MPRFKKARQIKVGKKINSLEPFFSFNAELKIRALTNQNLILVAADVDYALEHINFMLLYSKLFSQHKRMPRLICAIFDSSCIDTEFAGKFSHLSTILDCHDGIVVVDFLASYFSDNEICGGGTDYFFTKIIINFIKCARFSLVQKLWDLTGCQEPEINIGESNSLVYVMDYDFIANDNFDLAIRSEYSKKFAAII